MSAFFRFFLLFLISKAVFAQENLKFKAIPTEMGLSDATTYCILQDSRGFLWVGTRGGLNRFDGYHFTVFKNKPTDSLSIGDNFIRAIFEDSQQNIWIGTEEGGLNLYDRQKNNFKKIKGFDKTYAVRSIVEDQQKCLWVATWNGLYKSDAQKKQFQKIKSPFEHFPCNTIALDKEKVWVGTHGEGLAVYTTKTKAWKVYKNDPNNSNSLAQDFVETIYQDNEGLLWLGTREKGMDSFDPESENFTHFIHENNKENTLGGYGVYHISGRDNKIWVAVENSGLNSYDKVTKKFTYYVHDKNDAYSLNSNATEYFYEDQQGRFWVGTFDKGLNVADAYEYKFFKNDIPLENSTVNTIFKDSKKRLWLGTEDGIVLYENNKISYLKNKADDPTSLAAKAVLSINEDKDGRIWVGTWQGGLNLFDEKTRQFKKFVPNAKQTDAVLGINIFSVYLDKQKNLWIGGFGGFSKMISEGKFKNYTFPPYNRIRTIREDSKGNFWVGTMNGLLLFNPSTETSQFYLKDEKDSTALNHNNITSIFEDSKKRLWIGTEGGLHRFLDGKFQRFSTENGLPNDLITGILEDDKGYLWISTNSGLSRFLPEQGTFRNFDETDNLQGKQFKVNSCFKADDGELFFGGTQGYSHFYPERIKDNPHLPPVYLTNLKIFNQNVAVGTEILPISIQDCQQITLSYKESVFTIEYVALNFTVSSKNQYAYKLEGFDKDWNMVGTQRSATYTNLDAGTYIFKVKAANNDGVWNETGTQLKIIITPPFWKTWWFRVISFAIFLLSAYSWYWYRMNQMLKQNHRLENLVDERTIALKEKAEQLSMANEELNQQQEELLSVNNSLENQKNALNEAYEALNEASHSLNQSIAYASKIQTVILPDHQEFAQYFADFFILFRPRNVVSGDFYWFKQISQTQAVFALGDCTGHGVPAGFMSMLGATLLHETVEIKKIYDPARILRNQHAGIRNILKQDIRRNDDGMDISIVFFEKKPEQQQIHFIFSGAKTAMMYFDEEMNVLKGNRILVGGHDRKSVEFDNQAFNLPINTLFYLYSDGFIDQHNAIRQRIGSSNFKKMLFESISLDFKDQQLRLEKLLDQHQGQESQRDDITIIGLKF